MVGKMPNITWLEGSFVETIKGWQSAWFYITEPRDTKWVAAPKFRSGFPTRRSSDLGKGKRYLDALEQHPPDVLVCRVEKLAPSLVLGRVELPQVEIPLLT